MIGQAQGLLAAKYGANDGIFVAVREEIVLPKVVRLVSSRVLWSICQDKNRGDSEINVIVRAESLPGMHR